MAINRLNIKTKLISLALASSLSINLSGCCKNQLKPDSNSVLDNITTVSEDKIEESNDTTKVIDHNIEETNPNLFKNLDLRGDGKTTANLRFRVGPATDYKMIELLDKGTEVEIIGITEDNWYLVQVNDVIGYVSGNYISFIPSNKKIDGVRPNKYMYITTTNAELRRSIETDESICTIEEGTQVEYLDYLEDGWFMIRINNDIGYIKEEDISFKNPNNNYRDDFIKVIYATKDIMLREEPNNKSNGLYEISDKEACEVLQEEGSWYLVRCNNQTGYIPKIFTEDLTGVFIVVDISEQTLTLYDGNTILLEIDIVTGTKNKHDTPYGLYSIQKKVEDAVLKGQGYRSHVDYWMPFYYGYGLHDASWKKEFGGDIYINNGSHGCVNIPPENTPQIYNSIDVGTKVLVHK